MNAPRPSFCSTVRRCLLVGGMVSLLSGGVLFGQYDLSSPTTQRADTVPVIPLPIFFPPNPPPLDRPISRLASSATGQTFAPPAALSPYVTELFYAPLSTRLVRNSLDAKLRGKLAAYRSARDPLLAELQAELAVLRDSPPATRRTALVALAQKQAVRLTALEAAAENLRADLVTGDTDWRALRDWRVGERNVRGDSPAELGAVMRAYAFYQTGLLPDQRQLLREIVIELTSGAEDATTALTQQPFLFFSPALTRVTLPVELPAEVASKLALFETKKSALKKELFDTALAQDGATFGFTRTHALKSLAAKQTPALTELERLADEIRDGLVDVPLNPADIRPPLTPGLTLRVMEAVQARTELQKATRTKVDAVLKELPENYPIALSTAIDTSGIKVRLVQRRPGNYNFYTIDPRFQNVINKLRELSEEHGRRNEDLNREVETLRGDVGRLLGTGATGVSIDTAIDATIRYHVRRENDDAYRDYRLAVFEPGLSPEQRRLLLGGAIRKLDLYLPGGELQPVERAKFW